MTDQFSTVWGPKFEEMLSPSRVEPGVRTRACTVRQSDPLDQANLYNISWRSDDDCICYDVLPTELTGVEAKIAILYGCSFPSGSHKVGAAYSILLEKQLVGQIAPGRHTLLWPSTGNYGIGGAWVGGRMGYQSIVVLPQTVSRERFEMLERYGATVVKTPGVEGPGKEIMETSRKISEAAPGEVVILNQFEAFGNYRFHYFVTGNTVVDLARELGAAGIGRGKVDCFCSAMGSGGTIAAGDRVKQVWPDAKVIGVEPQQCSALYNAGFGQHEIQGIGDGSVTWIHNVWNMDGLVCVDDLASLKGLQLLTDEAGARVLREQAGVTPDMAQRIASWVGISGVTNVLAAIKVARYYQLSRDALIVTVCTDGLDRYHSTLGKLVDNLGPMDESEAGARLRFIFHGQSTDWIKEGTVDNRTLWHNLKYFPWVEQQGKSVEELARLRDPEFWAAEQALVADIDKSLERVRTAVA